MVNRRTQRGGGARAPTTSQLHLQIKNMERRLTGYKTTPSENPTAFVQLPWNSFTFERTNVTVADFATETVTVNDILVQLAAKCGLAATPPTVAIVRVKVQSAQVWCTVASTLLQPDIQVAFFELSGEATPTAQQPRSTQRDLGTLNKPARCGYSFPSADKREIISEAATLLKVVSTDAVTSGSAITTRVQVLWQSSLT